MNKAIASYMLDVLNRINDWEWACFTSLRVEPISLIVIEVYKFTNAKNRFSLLFSRNFKDLDYNPVDIDFNNDKSVVEFIRNHIDTFYDEIYYD